MPILILHCIRYIRLHYIISSIFTRRQPHYSDILMPDIETKFDSVNLNGGVKYTQSVKIHDFRPIAGCVLQTTHYARVDWKCSTGKRGTRLTSWVERKRKTFRASLYCATVCWLFCHCFICYLLFVIALDSITFLQYHSES